MRTNPIKLYHFDSLANCPFTISYDKRYVIDYTGFQFGEKYYIIYKDKLCACKLISVLYCVKGKDSTGFLCEVAGHGKVIFWGDAYFFKSVEAYEEYIKTHNSLLYVQRKAKEVDKLLSSAGIKMNYMTPVVFEWNGIKAVQKTMNINCVWADKDGLHIECDELEELGTKYFSTEEACISANKVNVVEFEDESVETEREFDFTLNFTIKAKSLEEAKKQFKLKENLLK